MQIWIKRLLLRSAIMAGAIQFIACTYEPPTTTGAGGSAGTGAGAGGEHQDGSEGNCLDALDGDGDGLIDCADPDCNSGYECVGNAIAGFGEHVRIVINPANAPTPPCPIESEMPIVRGKSAAVAACTSCECNVEVKCADEDVHFYTTLDCMGTPQTITATTDCVAIPTNGPTLVSYDVTFEKPTGTCTTSKSVKTPDSPWAEVVNACPAFKTTGAGCGEGRFCVPRSASPYGEGICVQAPGNLDCSGEYGQKIVAFDGVDDLRSCSPCECQAEFQCKDYMLKLDSAADCKSGTLQSSPFSCTQIMTGTGSMSFSPPISEVTKKDCTGGLASGEVAPQNARTFCCTK